MAFCLLIFFFACQEAPSGVILDGLQTLTHHTLTKVDSFNKFYFREFVGPGSLLETAVSSQLRTAGFITSELPSFSF